jgi:hypothetical protein
MGRNPYAGFGTIFCAWRNARSGSNPARIDLGHNVILGAPRFSPHRVLRRRYAFLLAPSTYLLPLHTLPEQKIHHVADVLFVTQAEGGGFWERDQGSKMLR